MHTNTSTHTHTVGGQLVGTLVFIHGHAPHGQQGFYGALTFAGGVFGVLLGAVVGTVIQQCTYLCFFPLR